ncbi:MAG TPA: hypothetical protein VF909_12575 [Roseiflexaceae bacterium]
MQSTEQRLADLRREIDTLKVALQLTDDIDTRFLLYTYLVDRLKESIRLVEQRLSTAEDSADKPPLERSVGERPSV